MGVSKTMFRLAIVVVGLSLVAASGSSKRGSTKSSKSGSGYCPAGTSRVRYEGQDISPQMDISQAPSHSEESCYRACEHNSRCNSAVRLVRDNGDATCYLKTGTVDDREPALNTKNESQYVINKRFTVLGCSTPSKPSTPTTTTCPHGTKFTRFLGTNVSGKNLARITGISITACDAECAKDNHCNSSVFVKFGGGAPDACYTKSASVDTRHHVDADERSRFTSSGCATVTGTVTPVDPVVKPTRGVCDATTCVGGTSGGSNKCAGRGIVNEVLGCCGYNFSCFQETEDFAQCRDTTKELPSRFNRTPLPCGVYGDSGPLGTYI